MKLQKAQAFTLIELLVVISIIAILAGIALPVFGEVKIRGDQTKALSNAKQIGTACKIYATDNNGLYPHYSSYASPTATTAPTNTEASEKDTSNAVLRNLIPDYLPDRSIFVNAKSKFTKKFGSAALTADDPLPADTNQWAYVTGLTDTSNSRWPLLADGFVKDTVPADPSYSLVEGEAGGVWRGKKAVVIRVDGSGTVETLLTGKRTVKRTDDDSKNAFQPDTDAASNTGKIPWFTAKGGVYVLNPIEPAAN